MRPLRKRDRVIALGDAEPFVCPDSVPAADHLDACRRQASGLLEASEDGVSMLGVVMPGDDMNHGIRLFSQNLILIRLGCCVVREFPIWTFCRTDKIYQTAAERNGR